MNLAHLNVLDMASGFFATFFIHILYEHAGF